MFSVMSILNDCIYIIAAIHAHLLGPLQNETGEWRIYLAPVPHAGTHLTGKHGEVDSTQ